MKIGLVLGGYCAAVLLAGCSSSAAGPGGTSDASSGDTAVGEAGVEGQGGASISGQVVDMSSGNATTGWDYTQYPGIEGVKVCVYGDASVPCVTTDASGNYTLALAEGPSDTSYYLSFTKTGFDSMLWGASGTGRIVPMYMQSTAWGNSWYAQAGLSPDPTRGTILFDATTLSFTGPFTFLWQGTEYYFLEGFTVTTSPAAAAGPVYTSAGWEPDPSLTSSSAAGWGIFQAVPGEYTLTFTDPSVSCGTATAKVVAGYWTFYVIPSPPCKGTVGSDAGSSNTGSDSGPDGSSD